MARVIWENFGSPGARTCARMVAALRASGFTLPDALAFVAYKLAYYEPDTVKQTIRTPDRVLDDSAANCVDYTVVICCAALHFSKDVGFELASYGPGDFSHVYPVIEGVPVDVVPFQDQSGGERFSRGLNILPKLATGKAQKIKPMKTKYFDLWNWKF